MIRRFNVDRMRKRSVSDRLVIDMADAERDLDAVQQKVRDWAWRWNAVHGRTGGFVDLHLDTLSQPGLLIYTLSIPQES